MEKKDILGEFDANVCHFAAIDKKVDEDQRVDQNGVLEDSGFENEAGDADGMGSFIEEESLDCVVVVDAAGGESVAG